MVAARSSLPLIATPSRHRETRSLPELLVKLCDAETATQEVLVELAQFHGQEAVPSASAHFNANCDRYGHLKE